MQWVLNRGGGAGTGPTRVGGFVRATVEQLSRDLAGDPKHIYKHKYNRKAHLAGDPKRKG